LVFLEKNQKLQLIVGRVMETTLIEIKKITDCVNSIEDEARKISKAKIAQWFGK
jgi:hypothetical protein